MTLLYVWCKVRFKLFRFSDPIIWNVSSGFNSGFYFGREVIFFFFLGGVIREV